jgi:hypothetical protein
MTVTKFTGLLLIVVPIAFNVLFFQLQRVFGYPEVLRKPPDHILRTFDERRRQLIPLWYGFMLTPILFIFAGVLAPQVLATDESVLVSVATALAVAAGLVQALGLARWPFVVPHLAREYSLPSTSQASRDVLVAVFETLHRYAGVAVGEHLGYLFTGFWTVAVGVLLIRSPLFPAWLGWIGFLPALGILVGLLEEGGIKQAGAVNAVSFVLWSVWLVAIGVMMVLG